MTGADIMQQTIAERIKKIKSFLNERFSLVSYCLLAVAIFLGVYIRTRNLGGLRDITTGGWALGPDLDPYLFLRWAEYIVQHGHLYALDTMRYFPIGYQTSIDYLLLPHLIAAFHTVATFFGSTSVVQSAALYPVFMYVITAISFYFLTYTILKNIIGKNWAKIAAIMAVIFLGSFPVFLPRSIAGIPEKESTAFAFMFLAIGFFIEAWNSLTKKRAIILSVLAGVSTALMSFVWGAWPYIFFIIGASVFVSFVFNAVTKIRKIITGTFLFTAVILMVSLSQRYSFRGLLSDFGAGIMFVVFAILMVDSLLTIPQVQKTEIISKLNSKITPRINSLIIGGILILIIGISLIGPTTVLSIFRSVYDTLVRPGASRLLETVAENKRPYFVEWVGNFGPMIKTVPLTLLLASLGSFLFLIALSKKFEIKERWMIIGAYALLFSSIAFSQYSSNSVLNGTSGISLLFYFAGPLLFIVIFGKIYLDHYKQNKIHLFSEIPFEALALVSFFMLGLISARSFIRLVMILSPPVSIYIGYIFVKMSLNVQNHFKNGNTSKSIAFVAIPILVILSIVFSAYSLSQASIDFSRSYAPSSYNQQWQKAMAWVREETPVTAVFAHWWDYGYWVQSIGQRATMLDGGNSIGYWNYLMGRYGLTEPHENDTLRMFYAHNITNFLIDSSDIGKYGAFSSIGSNKSYDRRSWIPNFLKDDSQTVQRKNSTVQRYMGGTSIDEDLSYQGNETNGQQIFLPGGKAGIGAVDITIDTLNQKVINVNGIFVYNNKVYSLPLRYYSSEQTGLVDLGSGLDIGVFVYPRVVLGTTGASIDSHGSLLYLSNRVVHGSLARYYLYGQQSKYISLAHSEDDFLVSQLKTQGAPLNSFVYYNEFRGPIKIWNITYPRGMVVQPQYLQTDYPAELNDI